MTDIGRLITAMVTPFDAAMEIDYGQARRLAQALAASAATASSSPAPPARTRRSPTRRTCASGPR